MDDKKDVYDPKGEPVDYGSCVEGKGKPWDRIGAKGKKSYFFNTALTYKQVMKKGKRGKNPHYRLGRAYIDAKLYIVGGAEYGRNVVRAMQWVERYFATHGPRDASTRRALKSSKAMKLRKTMNNKKRVLVKYGKRTTMPRCDVA